MMSFFSSVSRVEWLLFALTLFVLLVGSRIASALEAINGNLTAYLDAMTSYLDDIRSSISNIAYPDTDSTRRERD